MSDYVHGYDQRENQRLEEQAKTLVELLHWDTHYEAGEEVLEAGCGVGAQTVTLAVNSPKAEFTSIDISEESVNQAREKIKEHGYSNVCVQQGNIFDLPFEKESFDHIFVCFVLEHLPDPVKALEILKGYLKPSGTLTLIEGDHGSTYFYPDSVEAHKAIECQVMLQSAAGGNANIGREVYPMLAKAGFTDISVSPRMVYVDGSKPELIEGFTKGTFTAMIEGIKDSAVEAGLISESDMAKGIADLYRTAEDDGVFCYTFFKGVARKI